jgi:hypothetical protein
MAMQQAISQTKDNSLPKNVGFPWSRSLIHIFGLANGLL